MWKKIKGYEYFRKVCVCVYRYMYALNVEHFKYYILIYNVIIKNIAKKYCIYFYMSSFYLLSYLLLNIIHILVKYRQLEIIM